MQDAGETVREFPAVFRVDDGAPARLVKLDAVAVVFHLVNPAAAFGRSVTKCGLGRDDKGQGRHAGHIARTRISAMYGIDAQLERYV